MAKKSDISESQENLLNKINELAIAESSNSLNIGNIQGDIKEVKESVENLTKKVEEYYVNNDRFWPVKTLVYGFAGGILLTVLFSILSLVLIPRMTVSSNIPLISVEKNANQIK